MTTVTASAGLIPLQAPLPAPRSFDLLSTVDLVEADDDRWLGGAWTGGEVPGPAFTHDPCSTGTDRVKDPAGIIGDQRSGRFSIYLPGFCTAVSIGPDPSYWTDRLEQVFRIYEGAALERVLATGDGHMTFGPYLGNANLERLNGAGLTDPIRACGLLEQAVAAHGGGIIHVGPRTLTAWKAANLLPDPFMGLSCLGTKIAVGYGYASVSPDEGPPPAGDQEWAFATGPIQVIRDRQITLTPARYSEAIDRRFNDVLFMAERPYLFNWLGRTDPGDPDHTQAGVLVDLSATTGGTGGGPSYSIETPTGSVNGINRVFHLSTTPDPADALLVWKNGLLMSQTIDYTLVGTTITFVADQTPPIGAIIVAAIPT